MLSFLSGSPLPVGDRLPSLRFPIRMAPHDSVEAEGQECGPDLLSGG